MAKPIMKPKLDSRRLALGLAASLWISAPVSAQETLTKESDAAPVVKKAEKIRITGSRVKRTDSEGVSPVLVFDRDLIEKSGAATVSELLQNMTIASNGSYASSTVNDSRGTVTNVNLRGLGAENTLVLLDGRRLPDEAGLGVVDLSTVPMAAVERIEVLKESASAIYGSDATGGVVNIITRKDLDGSVFTARGASPKAKGGAETEFSYVTGTSSRRFRTFTMLNYRHTEAVYHRDRDWTKVGLSSYSSPGNYIVGKDFVTHPNCPEDLRLLPNPDKDQGNLCAYNYGATSGFSPEVTQLSFLNNLEYDINDKLTLYTTVRANKNTNLWNMAPNAGEFVIAKDVVNKNLPRLGLNQEVDTDITVRYRATPWGTRIFDEEKTSLGASAGLKGTFNHDWDWNFSVGRTESKKDQYQTQGFALKDRMSEAMASGTFSGFDVALAEENQSFVDSISYIPFEITESTNTTYNFDVSGELFEMGGGNAGLAVGVARTEQGYGKAYDPQTENDNVFGVEQNESSAGERSISAAYVELVLPLTTNFELQLAARHDVYSDFGGTTNPKLGFRYLPTSNWLVRGGVGTGFKAPSLNTLHRGRTVTLPNLRDPVTGELVTEIELVTQGNLALEEETSEFATFGTVVEPFDGLSLAADYWYLKIKDVVQPIDPQEVLYARHSGEDVPDGVEVSYHDDDPSGPIKSIKVPTVNNGEKTESGIDLNTNYRLRLGADTLAYNADYSRKFYSRSVSWEGAPVRNRLGERGAPEWRGAQSVSYSLEREHTFTLRQNLIGSNKARGKPHWQIDEYKTFDAQYAWAHPWDGTVAVGALNILDTRFPADRSERLGDDRRVQELYSANGLTMYLKLEQVF